eukprot:snap_masked-scaffold_15-processed-gene-6.37-mRNA-1 protein AED:1.00 eAED:1.00 QI:0/0/0/0/1/1/2/0/168
MEEEWTNAKTRIGRISTDYSPVSSIVYTPFYLFAHCFTYFLMNLKENIDTKRKGDISNSEIIVSSNSFLFQICELVFKTPNIVSTSLNSLGLKKHFSVGCIPTYPLVKFYRNKYMKTFFIFGINIRLQQLVIGFSRVKINPKEEESEDVAYINAITEETHKWNTTFPS